MQVRPSAQPAVAVQGCPIGALPAVMHWTLPSESTTSQVWVDAQPHWGVTPQTLLGAARWQSSSGTDCPASPVAFVGVTCVAEAVGAGAVSSTALVSLEPAVSNGVRVLSEVQATSGAAIAHAASAERPKREVLFRERLVIVVREG
jgi:hypothetical protein